MDIPRIISVDDHVVEPATVWIDRLPKAYADRTPRLVRVRGHLARKGGAFIIVENSEHPAARWADEWHFDGARFVVPAAMVQVHEMRRADILVPTTYDEMAPGCYDQRARLEDMNLNHTEASLCFPTVPRFCGQIFLEQPDKELSLLCVRAYNDWMIDEWCGGQGAGRLIPVTLVPMWDAELAAAEVRRCAEKGAGAITFSECPPYLGLPSIHSGYWDPLWQSCEDTQTVVNMHIGSSSTFPSTGPDSPMLVSKAYSFQNAMTAFIDWLSSGILVRFKTLRIALSEGQVGWIPFVLGRLDNEWKLGELFEPNLRDRIPEPPSAYVDGRVYGCIFDDYAGLRVRDEVGMSQIMFETDYPHGDTSFPRSKEMVESLVQQSGLDQREIWQLVRGNAIDCYRLARFGLTN